tara:strand:+ start:91 stop:780 length:690 start_codon:yes stop_codon:yes gene_type:complete
MDNTTAVINNLLDSSTGNTSQFEIFFFILALSLSIVFSSILKFFYVKFWKTISDKENISSNFILLTLIITIIIAVVKSSLALSLGLVGALSIVRFRTPIKDPEELIFLFICIALGLSLGAFQFVYASLGLFFIVLIIFFRSKSKNKKTQNNFFLTINENNFDIENFLKKGSNFFETIILKKFEKNDIDKEIIFNMSLKKDINFKEFELFLKDNNIKNYTFYDQDNFFQS